MNVIHVTDLCEPPGLRGYYDSVPVDGTKTTSSPGIGLHNPLHGRQACPELNSFHQGVGQIRPPEGLFSCSPLSKRGKNCYIPTSPLQSLNDSGNQPRFELGDVSLPVCFIVETSPRAYRLTSLQHPVYHREGSRFHLPLEL